MSIPGMDLDNRPIVSSLPTTIKTLMADLDCLCLRLAVPDLDFLEESTLINSSARPSALRHFRRSLVFVIDSMSFETTTGKFDILSTLWPRLSILSFLAVAAMAEHRASLFSFLLIFLYIFFHDSGGCGALPCLTPATPAACPALANPSPRALAILAIPNPVLRDSALTISPAIA